MVEGKVETIEKQSYLQPTVRLVNAVLSEIDETLRQRCQDGDLSGVQKKLALILIDGISEGPRKSKLVYDGEQVTASGLRGIFGPLSEKDLGYGIDSKFKRLVADLEIIELLEKGGIDGVNKKVGELFDSLNVKASIEQKTKTMEEMR